MKRGWEGRIVKGNRNNQTISGVITKSKVHFCEDNEVEIILAEVLFQVDGNNRAIYAYTEQEFHIIRDCQEAPAGLEFA